MNDKFVDLCRERGVSVYRVSRETGIPSTTLNAWANGTTSTLKDKNAAKLADYFGVSIDYLMGREETKKQADQVVDLFQEVLGIFMGLSEARKRQAMEYLRFLKTTDNS